jgi:alanyl-tRNA synthetase
MFSQANYSNSQSSPNSSKNSPRRSRSPSRSKKSLKKHREDLSKVVQQLKSKKNRLTDEKNHLRDDIKEFKKEIELLKSSLESYKSGALIFLPCGHQKIVKTKFKEDLDETFKKALDKLTQEELKNEIFLRQMRSKIFYALESINPEAYRCSQLQRYVNERCGHTSTAECHETKKYAKQLQYPPCSFKLEVQFECGHSDFVECSSKINAKCLRCI